MKARESLTGVENELREIAGLVSRLPGGEELRPKLHLLADLVGSQASPFLNVTEFARLMGIDRKDVRRDISQGAIPTVDIAGRVRIDVRRFDG